MIVCAEKASEASGEIAVKIRVARQQFIRKIRAGQATARTKPSIP
jgi:hypothetical protein